MKKIPVYFFNCGKVGHGDATYSFTGSRRQTEPSLPSEALDPKSVQMDVSMQFGETNKEQEGVTKIMQSDKAPVSTVDEEEREFGPWLKPWSRHGRG